MKKLIISITISIIILIPILVYVFNKDDNNDSKLYKLKVSEVTHSIFYAPFYVAIENGYFEENGLDIELILTSGSDNVAASVLSKDTKIGLAGPESAVYVYTGGEKDYLEIFAGLTKRDGQFLLSRNKDFKWEDLIGKEILIGRKTGMPGMSFMKALENQNIDKEKVNINSSIDFAELSGAFLAGEGDYVNLFEPLATNLENNDKGFVQVSIGLYSDEFPYTAFYAQKSYIDENEDIIKKFNKALNKGIKFTLENDSNKIAKSIKNQFKETSVTDLSVQIDRYKKADVWLNNTYIEEDFYNSLINLLKENKLLDKEAKYSKLVNNID